MHCGPYKCQKRSVGVECLLFKIEGSRAAGDDDFLEISNTNQRSSCHFILS